MSNCTWKLTNDEYEFIKGEVCHIFELYNIRCIPVSGFEIASKMQITLIPYSSLPKKKRKKILKTSKDGFFVENDGKEYIYYNNIGRDYTRQNWTILHEIGHVVLDHIGCGEKEEAEADFFAKYAIAPPVLVHEISAESAEDIHSRFDISEEAAEYAYQYYLAWMGRYKRVHRLQSYEAKLLALYRQQA